jgi:hypothetical protein
MCNEIDPAHRLQGCDDLGKGPLAHRVTDRLLRLLPRALSCCPGAHRMRPRRRASDTASRPSGTDPDPRIRAELRRDGSSSWEAD